jgi:hypothetical protein
MIYDWNAVGGSVVATHRAMLQTTDNIFLFELRITDGLCYTMHNKSPTTFYECDISSFLKLFKLP